MDKPNSTENKVAEERDTMKDIGVMFLCAVAGYGLSQYQNSRRSENQITYQRVTNTRGLPSILADKAEEVIRAGGQAGIRKVGALLELVVQNATGDTTIFREAADVTNKVADGFDLPKDAPKGAAGTRGRRSSQDHEEYATNVEYYDPQTKTWVPCE
jgi:hypothetical protein